MKIKNRIFIYIFFGLISITMIITAAFFIEYVIIFNILNGIGCSIFSAILLAIVIDLKDYFSKKQEIIYKRKEYFENINNEITNLIEKILWYDILIDEKEPLLNKSVAEQNSVKFMIYTFEKYKNKISTISYKEAKAKLEECEQKYSLDRLVNLSKDEIIIINNVFSVIADNSLYLIKEIDKLEKNKVILDSLNYITIKQIDTLRNETSMFYQITSSNNKNFGAAITLLIICSDIVRNIGKYNNKITITPKTKGALKDL